MLSAHWGAAFSLSTFLGEDDVACASLPFIGSSFLAWQASRGCFQFEFDFKLCSCCFVLFSFPSELGKVSFASLPSVEN